MIEPAKTVFLSYASLDAVAAKRICEALRQGSSMDWKKGKRLSFLIQHRGRSWAAGAPELPKHLSAGSTA